jgi:hypothetical protein
MSSKTPIIRQTSWLMVIPQLLVMTALIALVAILLRPKPLVTSVTYGAFLFLVYSYGSRWLILKSHRQGIRLTRQKNYQAASEKFDESYQFFSDHAWVDRYRFLTLMSPSLISFREMALINSAFCHSQLGDIVNTKKFYQKTLEQFPESEMAKVALNLIAAAENQG